MTDSSETSGGTQLNSQGDLNIGGDVVGRDKITHHQTVAGDSIRVTIGGNVSGQVAVGKNIQQSQIAGASSTPVTEAELATLRQAVAELLARVEAEAPAEKRPEAAGRVRELEEALTAPTPDLTTLEYVRNWFAKHLPALAGGVTSLIVHPLVGKLVEAGGELLVDEFKRRFGGNAS